MDKPIKRTTGSSVRENLDESINRRQALKKLGKLVYAVPTLTMLSLSVHAQLPGGSPCGDPGGCPDQNPFLPPD